jgi:TonB family protein
MNCRIALALIGGALFLARPAVAAEPDSCPDTVLAPIMATHTIPPYPTMSQRLGEQGTTTLNVDIGADGIPTGTRVVKSSGSGRLDDAAAAFVKENWRWQAPTRKCKPIAFATNVSVAWSLNGRPPGFPVTVITAADSDFPKGAKAEGAHGSTAVAVMIAPDGTVDIQLAATSGFNDLDGAAFDKIKAMKFAPATSNGKPVRTILLFRIDWGAPASPPQAAPKSP